MVNLKKTLKKTSSGNCGGPGDINVIQMPKMETSAGQPTFLGDRFLTVLLSLLKRMRENSFFYSSSVRDDPTNVRFVYRMVALSCAGVWLFRHAG